MRHWNDQEHNTTVAPGRVAMRQHKNDQPADDPREGHDLVYIVGADA